MDDLGSSVIEQAALAAFIHNGHYATHVRKSVKEIANRRRAVVEALRCTFPMRTLENRCTPGWEPHLIVWFREVWVSTNYSKFIEHARSLGLRSGTCRSFTITLDPATWPGLLILVTPACRLVSFGLLSNCSGVVWRTSNQPRKAATRVAQHDSTRTHACRERFADFSAPRSRRGLPEAGQLRSRWYRLLSEVDVDCNRHSFYCGHFIDRNVRGGL